MKEARSALGQSADLSHTGRYQMSGKQQFTSGLEVEECRSRPAAVLDL